MSKYGAPDLDGTWHDIVWRKAPIDGLNIYRVFLGDEVIGQIHKLYAHQWAAISGAREPLGPRGVDGFRSRWAATEYILKVGGFRKAQEDRIAAAERRHYYDTERGEVVNIDD